ncbi:NADPH-dependent FMN reductase [Agromyces aerolatus]|uniref:NADPH-dependent FMN reductase n=1 Tax=Agromyces sp. LY-1074 TaxID=3074080 RepID=UPI00285AA991|nr:MULTISPECIES: NAD(P)H-dependent oxidoreductase [unclassified Agromyces]MDR5700901.1 NAD(P)H-dependent oxidoreductase [Agromyces sp. LY-1074]MDR5707438.1 NAD(P)H-dependent oxidoreductase [Agromyces sp. LY-1358]
MTLSVSLVVGNPKANSRTRTVAEKLIAALLRDVPHRVEVIDLAEHTDEIFRWPSETFDDLNSRVAASDLAIFATPTYKATYTGLLKAFLDRYPANGLSGVPAIAVTTGADLTHSMGPTVFLGPLLTELGAIVLGRGFYFVIEQMDRVDEVVQEAADQYAANIARIASLAAHARDWSGRI